MTIIDSQVHAYEANTPKRPWHSVPNWPAHVTGDEMVAAMDKVGVDGAIFISRLFHVPLRRELCGGSATSPSRPVRHRQAGRPGRSGGRRCHRRLEEDAGHGRHPHHDDEGGGARPERPGPRPHPARSGAPRLPGQYLVLGQSGRGHGADRPPPRHALHHRPSRASCSRARRPLRRSLGPTCRRCWISPSARTR